MRVAVARLVSQVCVQRAVEEIVDILVGVIKEIQQERVSKTNRGADCGFASSANHERYH